MRRGLLLLCEHLFKPFQRFLRTALRLLVVALSPVDRTLLKTQAGSGRPPYDSRFLQNVFSTLAIVPSLCHIAGVVPGQAYPTPEQSLNLGLFLRKLRGSRTVLAYL